MKLICFRRVAVSLRRCVLMLVLAIVGAGCLATGQALAAVTFSASSVDTGVASVGLCPWTITPTATPLVPAGTSNGDLMIATVSGGVSGGGGSYTPPAGWTLLHSDSTSGSLATYYRIANAEPASYSWQVSVFACFPSGSISAEIDVYKGNDRVTPLTAGVSSTGTAASINLPNDTASYPGSMRISSVASISTTTSVATSTFQTGLTMANHAEATTGVDVNVAAAYAAQGAGATTAYTDTLSRSVTKWLAATYIINPVLATKVVFTTQPVAGVAEGTAFPTQPAVSAQAASGAVATSDTSSVTLSIASGPGAGILSCTGGLTKATTSGVATFSGCQITGTGAAGTYTIQATDGGLTSATSSSFTIIVGGASKVGFTTQPVGGVAEGVNLGTQPAVSIQDAYGNTVTGNTSSVTLAIASGPGAGVLTCTTNPLAATAGVATFAGCKITGTAAAGAYTLRATDGPLTSGTSGTFAIVAGAATQLAFSTQPVGGVAEGVNLPTQPQVSVQDAYGNVVTSDGSSVTLVIASGPGSGTLSCSANPTPANSGIATFAACQIGGVAAAGSYTLRASDGALSTATSTSFTIVAGAATKLAFTTQPVAGVAENVAFPTQPAVSIQDAYANLVTANSSSVTLAIGSGPAAGVLSCTTNPLAASSGVATFAGCNITGTTAAGTYTLTATDGALTSAASASFTIVPGVATKVIFSTQPVGGVTPGVPVGTQPAVSIQDAYSNLATSDGSSVTLSIASGPAAGVLSCTANPLAAVAGVATFAGCKISGAGSSGTYTLTAADGALTSATSVSFTILAGSLSLTTSAYGFSGTTLNGQNQTATATLVLDVLDTTGAGAGWRISASTSAWTGGTSGSLASAQVATAQPATPTCDGGAGTCTPATPGAPAAWPLALGGTPATIYNATANTGLGPQTVNVPMSLAIPASTQAIGTFNQTVTLSITSGP